MIFLELLTQENSTDVFNFEQENKDYFERTLPPRPTGYFERNTFDSIVDELIREQSDGECYMYIVRNDDGVMVGRVNIFDVVNNELKSAEIGYRIGEAFLRKGYASEAVMEIIRTSKALSIDVLYAGTAVANIGSQRVLLKNGFEMTNQIDKAMKVHGEWIKGVEFKKIID